MAKHVSVIVSGAGWIAGFTERLIEALEARGCTHQDIHALVTSKARPAMEKIADAVAELIRQAKNVAFCLTGIGDGRTTEELVWAGNYNYANPNITSKNFPARAQKRGVVDVVLLEFDRDVTSEEAIAEATKQGLERPTHEDALYFGVEHPEVQRERPVVFLHEPWRAPHGDPYVLVLWSYAGYRLLFLYWFGLRWPRGYRFAFVRK